MSKAKRTKAIAKVDRTAPIDKAAKRAEIAACKTPTQAKTIADQASAIRRYLKKAGESLEKRNDIAEIEIDARVKCGELLAATKLAGRGGGDTRSSNKVLLGLDHFGIERMESSRMQALARVPERARRAYIRAKRDAHEELTITPLYNMARAISTSEAAEAEQIVDMVVEGEAKNVQQAKRQIADEKRVAKAKDAPPPAAARLVIGDVLSNLDAFQGAACIVTDPPYGLDTHRTREGGQDYADGADYALELLDRVCAGLVSRLAPDAHLYVFSGYTYVHAFKAILGRHFDVQDNPLIWVKRNHTMRDFSQGYANRHEYVLFAKMRGSKRPIVNGAVGDVFETGPIDRQTTHSAEKPVTLLEKFIEQSTMPAELVGDPFAGSGSTGVAAVARGRAFVGTELDPKWAATADARIKGAASAA